MKTEYKMLWEFNARGKKQISEILTDRGYADSAISLYNRIARIKDI